MGHPARDPEVRELVATVERLVRVLTGQRRGTLDPDDWVSIAELAQLTGKHASTVRRWINDHNLPAKLLPGSSGYLIRYGDFVVWCATEDESPEVITDVIRRLDRAS